MADQAADAHARVLAKHPEAVVVERGRNNLKHRLADAPDGKQRFALDVGIGPLHYEKDGEWCEIDTAFEPSAAPWDWEMTKAGFEVRALSRLDAGQVIEYRSGSEYVRFQPMGLQYSNALDQIQLISMPTNLDATVDGDTLIWSDGYGPGIGISWQAQTARLAKRLTIDSLTALPSVEQYILDGAEPVLELNFIFAFSSGITPYVNGQPWGRGANRDTRDTQGLVEFRNGEGKALWWFNLPRSWDAEGNEQLGRFRFKRLGNALYVSHRVPLAFVQSGIYPVQVDVDVNEQVVAGADDAFRRYTTSFFGLTGNVGAGAYDADYYQYCSGMRFQTVPIAQGVTIDAAYLTLRASYSKSGTTVNTDIRAEDVDDAAEFSDLANWDSRFPSGCTTAEVQWDGISAWTQNTDYNSAEIKTVIKEIVDRGSWASDNDLVIFWDDYDDRSTHDTDCLRYAYSYDDNTTYAPKLHIEYSTDGVSAEVIAVTATATAAAPLPTITAVKNVTISAVTAIATAAAPLPSVAISKTIAAVTAVATAAAPLPTITAIKNVTIAAVTATATATAPSPTITTTGKDATITAVTATATAAAPLPTITAIKNVTIAAAVATAVATAPTPTVAGNLVYAQFGKIIAAIDPDDYPSDTTLKLLVVIWTSAEAEPVYARLYNVTDSAGEKGSLVNTDSESPVEVLSSALSLPSGEKTYRVDVGGVAGGTYYCAKAAVEAVV